MRLARLDPQWVTLGPGRHGQGIVFLCPCCLSTRKLVVFDNPLDGMAPIRRPGVYRRGACFESLSLEGRIVIDGHCSVFVDKGSVVEVG